MENYKSCA